MSPQKKAGRSRCVVFAINAMMGGGAERVVLELVNRFKVEGLETVLLLGRKEGPYLDRVAKHVRVLSVDVPLGIFDTVKFAKKLKGLLSGLEPLIIISHLTPMNRMLLRCRKLGAFNAPISVVEHNNIALQVGERSGLKGCLLKLEIDWLYSKVSAIVGVSQGVVDSVFEVTDLNPKLGRVIYNPVDVRQIQQSANEAANDTFSEQFMSLPRPVLISAGRLNSQKSFDDLIRAFHALPRETRGSLVIFGEGPLESKLRELVCALDLEEHVHFPGFVKNPWWYMKQSDLFVLSSHWEGFGLVIAEAMACGLPVVSTDCPYGPSEIIEDGVSGRLVPVGDVEALSNAMHACLASNTDTEKYVANGLERVEAFLPQVALTEYLKLLSTYDHEITTENATE